MQTQGPGIPPVAVQVPPVMPTQGPGIPPVIAHITVTQMQGPGLSPAVAPVPPAMPIQDPGIPAVTAHTPVTQTHGPDPGVPCATPSDTNMLPSGAEEGPNVPPTKAVIPATKTKELHLKRYQRPQKMFPGVGSSARYVLSPMNPHMFTPLTIITETLVPLIGVHCIPMAPLANSISIGTTLIKIFSRYA
jgi:hypothetical protein